MGKNYRKELDLLPEVYNCARECDCTEISDFIYKYQKRVFFAIGSGGSFSVAKIFEYMCTLSGITCKSITPLELGNYDEQLRSNVAVLFTAGGSNSDSRNAYTYLSNHEIEGILTCCMRKNSPIKRMQRENLHNYFFEHKMPVLKDGYLSVESLISFLTVLSRAFELATQNNFFKIGESADWLHYNVNQNVLNEILNKETIIVLHGGMTSPAAVDLESKFSETSLGNVQLVDFRNFAHGRHFWLSDRKDSTGVIALVSLHEEKVAKKTIQIIPEEIPVIDVNINDSSIVGLFQAFYNVFEIVYQAGMRRGIDPGKPKVAEFGKKMYHISYNLASKRNDIITCAAIRKKSAGMNDDIQECLLQSKKNYDLIKGHAYRGIVFDYDGTLHDKTHVSPIEKEIFAKINGLLSVGIKIGIATGRGKSVRKELREVIESEYWNDVVIAYYNGGCIGTLADDLQPDKTSKAVPDGFKCIGDFVEKTIPENTIKVDGLNDKNPFQLTIIYGKNIQGKTYFEMLKEFVREQHGLKMLESSHSLDIIPVDSSKNNIFKSKMWENYQYDDFLRIGDSGHLGGNDYELLKTPYGLSVDKVSTSPESCWNYAKQGMRNLEATLYYISEKIIVDKEVLKWR